MNEIELRSAIEQKSETRNVDFKRGCDWLKSSKRDKLELVKDMLAMANTQDGGSIVLGVEDGTFEVVGLTDEELRSFDQTKVNDYFHKFTEPLHTCQVLKHTLDGKFLVELTVPEFALEPIICADNGRDSENHLILQAGALYVRTEKASSEPINDSQAMRDLLRRASAKDSAVIIRDLERILHGRPSPTPESAVQAFKQEITDATTFIKSKIGNSQEGGAFWRFEAHPSQYNEKLIDIANVREIAAQSKVALRGWDYPHLDKDTNTLFQRGLESSTIWVHEIEAWRLYQSGLFVMESVTTEQMASAQYGKGIDFTVLIYILTEFYLFVSRLASKVSDINTYHLSASLNGISGFSLRSVFSPDRYFPPSPPSSYPLVKVERDCKTVDLVGNPSAEAVHMIREFFVRLNAQPLSPEIISKIQSGLLNRTF